MQEHKAAIPADMEKRSLKEMSAAEFLTVLTGAGVSGAVALRWWPEKKKVELFVEPEDFGRITVGGLIRGFREKKKYELEKDPRIEYDLPKRVGAEFELLDPGTLAHHPALTMTIQDIVAREVERQLKGTR